MRYAIVEVRLLLGCIGILIVIYTRFKNQSFKICLNELGMHIENEIEASVFISYAWGDKSGEFVGILHHRVFKIGWATPGMDNLEYNKL